MLTNILADVCPFEDDIEKNVKRVQFPLPDDHWINQPVDAKDSKSTLLELAIQEFKVEAAKLLIASGAKVDSYNELLGDSPLLLAVQNGTLEIVKSLFETCPKKPRLNVADIHAVNRKGQNALHLAANGGQVAVVKYLLGKDANVDSKDLFGQSALYLAAKKSYAEVCELLISNGAKIDAKISEVIKQEMPYFDASRIKVDKQNGYKIDFNEKLCHILDKGQRNAKKGLSNERNLIEFRIYLYQLSSSRVNEVKDASGMSLFQKACDFGLHEHVRRLLMDYECDPDCVTGECSTTGLLLAAYNGHHEVIRVIKEHKLDKNSGKKKASFCALEKSSGKSILHLALTKTFDHGKYSECVELILDQALAEELKKIINHKVSQ